LFGSLRVYRLFLIVIDIFDDTPVNDIAALKSFIGNQMKAFNLFRINFKGVEIV